MISLAWIILIYKLLTLLSGVFITYLGYKLFINGIFNETGDLHIIFNDKKLLMRRAAPGTFFALFGAVIVGLAVFKGISFDVATDIMNNMNRPVVVPPPHNFK